MHVFAPKLNSQMMRFATESESRSSWDQSRMTRQPDYPECPRAEPVSCDVAFQFWKPIIFVACRLATVFGASVPEAAVHKYHEAFAAKGEIRAARQWLVATPAGDSSGPEYGGEFEFRFSVPRERIRDITWERFSLVNMSGISQAPFYQATASKARHSCFPILLSFKKLPF